MIQKISVFMLTVIADRVGREHRFPCPIPVSAGHGTPVMRLSMVRRRCLGMFPHLRLWDLVLHLPVRDQAGLDGFLKDVYDPSSSSFHKFLTVEEFTERFGPTVSDYETVKAFAKANGFQILSTSRNRAILRVRGSIGTVEKALHVEHEPLSRPHRKPQFLCS